MQASIDSYSPLYPKSVKSATTTVSRYLKDEFATRRQIRVIVRLLHRGHDGQELKEILGTNRPGKVISQLQKRGYEIPSTRTIYFKNDGSLGWRTTYKLSGTDREKLARLVHETKNNYGRFTQ